MPINILIAWDTITKTCGYPLQLLYYRHYYSRCTILKFIDNTNSANLFQINLYKDYLLEENYLIKEHIMPKCLFFPIHTSQYGWSKCCRIIPSIFECNILFLTSCF